MPMRANKFSKIAEYKKNDSYTLAMNNWKSSKKTWLAIAWTRIKCFRINITKCKTNTQKLRSIVG